MYSDLLAVGEVNPQIVGDPLAPDAPALTRANQRLIGCLLINKQVHQLFSLYYYHVVMLLKMT